MVLSECAQKRKRDAVIIVRATLEFKQTKIYRTVSV